MSHFRRQKYYRLKVFLVIASFLLGGLSVRYSASYLNTLFAQSGSADPGGLNYCSNKITPEVLSYLDDVGSEASSWEECNNWCQGNMNVDASQVCEYDAPGCYIYDAPTNPDDPESPSDHYNCDWVAGGPPYGSYYNMPTATPTPTNSPTPTPTLAPAAYNGTRWCSNGGENFAAVDHDINSWAECRSWCETTMNPQAALCQYNADGPRNCWVNYGPGSNVTAPTPTYGDVNQCDWQSGAPPFGIYYNIPTPAILPGAQIDGSAYCINKYQDSAYLAVDHDVANWGECRDWCVSNMTSNAPLCQYNEGDPRTCWVVFAPEARPADPTPFYGDVRSCVWQNEAGIHGMYLGLPTPTGLPTATPTPLNIATSATATASSEYDGSYLAQKVNDNDLGIEWASLGEQDPWVRLDWDGNYSIDAISIYDRSSGDDDANGGLLSFSDGSSLPVTNIPSDGSAKDVSFSNKTVSWLKFQVIGGSGPNVGLAEIKVFGTYDSPLSSPTPTPTAVPTLIPGATYDGSTYCSNSEADKTDKTAPTNLNLNTWEKCWNWCKQPGNMSTISPLCQWNSTPDQCWTKHAPNYVNDDNPGSPAACTWESGASGAYYLQPQQADNNAPTLTFASVDIGATYNVGHTSFTFIGTANDLIGVTSVEFTIDDSNWQNCSLSDPGFSSSSFTCNAASLTNGQNYLVQVRATDTHNPPNQTESSNYSKFSLHIQTSIPQNLIANWDFNRGDRIQDQTLHLPDAYITTNQAGDTLASTQHLVARDSVYLDGATSLRVPDINHDLNFNGTNKSFEITAWVKPDGSMIGSNHTLISHLADNQTDSYWNLIIDSTFHLVGTVYDGKLLPTSVGAGSTKSLLNAGQWNQITFAWNQQDQSLLVKVNDNAPIIAPYPLSRTLPLSDESVYIGSNGMAGEYFTGEIDEVKIYNRAYTAAPKITINPLENPERVGTSTPSFTIDFHSDVGVSSAEYLIYASAIGSSLDAKNWQPITQLSSGNWGDQDITATVTTDPLTDRRWYIYVRAVDNQGIKSVYDNNPDGDSWFTATGYSSSSLMAYYRFVVEAVDSTPPNIFAHAVIPNPTTDRSPSVRGFVRDYTVLNEGEKASNIASIHYRIDNGQWVSINPLDNTFDSPTEEFVIMLNNLAVGEHTIEVKSADASGNDTNNQSPGDEHRNYIESFTITSVAPTSDIESITQEVNFSSRELRDPLYTDAVWGNGYGRIKEKINFSVEDKLFTNNDDFGYKYGEVNLDIFPSVDGNAWVVTNQNAFFYYNKSTGSYTRYPKPTSAGDSAIAEIYEINHASKRLLFVNYLFDRTIVFDINNSPENINDDAAPTDLTSVSNYNTPGLNKFMPFAVDTRNNGYSLIGLTNNNNAATGVAVINLNGSMTDFSDDLFTYWGSNDGVSYYDFTGKYFDQSTNTILLGSSSGGLFVCNDGGTPHSKADDSCYHFDNSKNTLGIYPIIKDTNGYYWFSTSDGVARIKLNNLTNQGDDEYSLPVAKADINLEEVGRLYWLPGTYPVGDELLIATRQGHLRILEYNYTYNDSLDDTSFDYRLAYIENRLGGSLRLIVDDKNTAWSVGQGVGLEKITMTRTFDDINYIEFLPVPPQGKLAINHITLDNVLGSVSAGSSHTFSDLVSYQVSNDDGLNWYPISLGQTFNFPTSGYKLKFRIAMTKGSTPIIDYVKLNYYAFTTPGTSCETDPQSCLPSGNGGGGNNGGGGGDTTCHDDKPGSPIPYLYKAQPLSRTSMMLYFNGSWGPVDKYVLRFGTKKGEYPYGAINIGGKGTTKYLVTHLKPNTTYYFQIRAGNGCATGDWSNVLKAKTFFWPWSKSTVTLPKTAPTPTPEINIPDGKGGGEVKSKGEPSFFEAIIRKLGGIFRKK